MQIIDILSVVKVQILRRDSGRDEISLQMDMIIEVAGESESIYFDIKVPKGRGEEVVELLGLKVDELIEVPKHWTIQ